MSDSVISVKHLSKRYTIGGPARLYGITDLFDRWLKFVLGKASSASKGRQIWAFRDVSFEVKRGETVAIIGRNGAGKSTMLKVFSRITEPTEGSVEINGRVVSLLEVGTGFHLDLTGRENIFLNGAILGMRKAEVKRKFDEIVAFAETGKFIDTAMKYYSSGMYVRLAFAVAAHLEPEILLVDEVLAVGDVAFQKKCLGKMGEVAMQGRTVIFVSHNMAAVKRLCQRAIWLNKGKLQMSGPTESVVNAYLTLDAELGGECVWENPEQAPGNDNVRIISLRMFDANGNKISVIDGLAPFFVEIEYSINYQVWELYLGFWILTSDGVVVFSTSDISEPRWTGKGRERGVYKSRCKVCGPFLSSGMYSISVDCGIRNVGPIFIAESVLRFQVEQAQSDLVNVIRPSGIVSSVSEWEIIKTG